MSFSKDSKQRLTAVAAVIIVALLGTNAFLLYNKYSQAQVIETQNTKIEEATKLQAELEKQYYESLSELEEMKGNNQELNTLIDQQKLELKEKKDKISRLIRQGKSSKSELKQAREEMAQLRVQLDQYVAENTKLKEDNEVLTQQNTQLTADNANLEEEVATQMTMNQEHVTARAALVSQNETLENVNSELSEKVTIASVVKVPAIEVTGWKVRKSGKAVKKKKAKSIHRVKVCFTAAANQVVEEGIEKFYLRVIDPTGETLAIEDLGSGVLTSNNNEDIRYTKVKEIDYSNQDVEACMLWEPNVPFQKGDYQVEIYNKGFLCGKGDFKLK
ncbi:MAG: hypothetical protein AAF985_20870 [Bacteroidota bacterium]